MSWIGKELLRYIERSREGDENSTMRLLNIFDPTVRGLSYGEDQISENQLLVMQIAQKAPLDLFEPDFRRRFSGYVYGAVRFNTIAMTLDASLRRRLERSLEEEIYDGRRREDFIGE